MTRYGYLWVGPLEHNTDFQRDLLQYEGVDQLFVDISAHTSTPIRPQLTAVLDRVRRGDTLVIWRLDRLGSTVSSVLSLLELLGTQGVGVLTIVEGLDTSAIVLALLLLQPGRVVSIDILNGERLASLQLSVTLGDGTSTLTGGAVIAID